MMHTIETPRGNVFDLTYNKWTRTYYASGPLQGGRGLVRLCETARVSVALNECDDPVRNLIDQLMELGY